MEWTPIQSGKRAFTRWCENTSKPSKGYLLINQLRPNLLTLPNPTHNNYVIINVCMFQVIHQLVTFGGIFTQGFYWVGNISDLLQST